LKQSNFQNIYFFELAKILGQQTDFEEILRLVVQKAAQFLKADLALILMVNPDTRQTVKTIMKDGKSIDHKEYRNIHLHVGGWIISKQKSFFSQHIQKDKRFVTGLFKELPPIAVAGAPLCIEGIIIGALILLYNNTLNKDEHDLTESLENIAAISAPFLRNAQKLREYFNYPLTESSLVLKYNNVGLYGKSIPFIELLHSIEAVTKCDVRVLLIGETGTGKERIARGIHHYSSRNNKPFVAVDCGAIPDKLLESEFFGHVKGAFTGAQQERQGLFLKANEGTLFLDEVNNLPKDMQVKLLRVLEDGEIRPVGNDKTIKTDIRIIAASSVSLRKLVEEKIFREDLFFRLHVYPIYIPSLKERNDDIPLLANYFLRNLAAKQNKKVENFHEEIIDFIRQRNWNGNIRELENFVERLITLITTNGPIIKADLFPPDLREEWNIFKKKKAQYSSESSLKQKVQDFEEKLIKQALINCNWNQSKAARLLQTSEKNIRYKMEKFNIQKSINN
jgi:Nif-specific regulatory protein